MNKRKSVSLVVILLIVALCLPFAGTAGAVVSISATTKKALDKTIASADSELKNKLNKQYSDFLQLQEQEKSGDARNKTIHYKNEDALAAVRKQMYEIDSAKIEHLEKHAEQTSDRYQPLFDMYKSLNRQISIAKSLGSKELASALTKQAQTMKVPLQLAREDIKLKKDALSAAKKERTNKIAQIRDTLSDIEPIEKKIKAERGAESIYKKNVTTEWSSFTRIVKKNDAKATSGSLAALISLSSQIVIQKQKMYDLEKKIGEIISKAKSQIPAG